MCGFVAFIQNSPVVDLDSARRAVNTMIHRGPNAGGEWREQDVCLFHRRLSIIDLATGDQPMQSGNQRYVIVFNGEIYNYRELRAQLGDEGVRFKTRSDTEVIVEGFRHWGESVVGRLNGIFAFVIWDRQERRVFVARDRLGIKPLSWTIKDGALIVTSTLEPFEVLKGFKDVDPVAVRDLLVFDYIPSPRTILEGVRKLEPGCQFAWEFGEGPPTITRYWSPPDENVNATPPSSEELEELLDRAIARQMISDVPVGAFLSGGIDSSLLVALMVRHSAKPVRTFSCAFGDSAVNESPIAELVARQFQTDHVVLQAEEIGGNALLSLFSTLDEPLADPALIPTYALSKMTGLHVRVALSGDGGDEVFGGYPKYLQSMNPRRAWPLGSQLDSVLRSVSWRPRGMHSLYWRTLSAHDLYSWSNSRFGDFPVFPKDLRQLIDPAHHERLQVHSFFSPWQEKADKYGHSWNADLFMRVDLETYLTENCLVKTDRASMLASLEVRVPFLDEMILDRILPLSADKKIINGELKPLLKQLAKCLLPPDVWNRPKHGFDVPVPNWLAGKWKPALDKVLEWGEEHVGVFNYSYLRRLQKENEKNRQTGRYLWNPFVLLAWMMSRTVKI